MYTKIHRLWFMISSVVLKKLPNETDNLENFEDYMNLTNGYKGECS